MSFLIAVSTAAALGLSISSLVQASDEVYFKSPIGVAGTGCPVGSAPVDGANSDTVSILFNQYDAGSESATGRERVACNFALPIHVSQGYQVSGITAAWEGFAKGKGQLKRKYFFAGQPDTIWLTSQFDSNYGTNFNKRDRFEYNTTTNSKCGRDVILRINSNIRTETDDSYIAVKNKTQLKLEWKRCDQETM